MRDKQFESLSDEGCKILLEFYSLAEVCFSLENIPLTNFLERIDSNRAYILPLLDAIEKQQTPDKKAFLSFIRFINAIDGDDLRDKSRPLRVDMFTQQGDPHVKAMLAKTLLLAAFNSVDHALAMLRAMLDATDIRDLKKSYWPFLVGGKLALELGHMELVRIYAGLAKSIHSTCPYIAELRIAGLQESEETTHGAHSLKERFCSLPFTNITTSSHTGAQGLEYSMSMCTCPGQLRFALDADNPWNGRAAQEIRRSILDGDYSYCDKDNCYAIRMGTLPLKSSIKNPVLRGIIDNNQLSLPYSPRSLTLAHDYTCNLACPSCRKAVYSITPEMLSSHNFFFKNTIAPMLDNGLTSIRIGNVGESLASPHIRGVLSELDPEQYPSLSISLMTNGTLANEPTWETLGPIAKKIRHVSVSIDGASAEVFETLRRPAKWDKLCANMEFLGSLRNSNQLLSLRVQCIVQKSNVYELPTLYSLCKSWNVDYLVFAQLRNWGAMTPETFAELDVANAEHPLHIQAQEIMQQIQKEARHEAINVYLGF